MVVTSRQAESHFANGRILDEDKITKALEMATSLGADYAEIRLVSETTNTASLKDGKLERAIPGQEVGVTMRILADGAWGVHSTSDVESITQQVDSTFRLAKAVASRRSPSQTIVELAEVPIIQDEIHWKSKKDIRETDLDKRIEMMLAIDDEAKDDEKIVSTATGWSDEHIHTELMTSEGMNRIWSFQRSLINGMVTARNGDDVVSYRMRHGGEGGLELIESCDLGEMGRNAKISALRLLTAERAPSGRMPLVADRDLTGVYIHEALGHPCEADLVAAGDSCLEGRLGETIGSEICTVIDDPTIRGGYGCYPIDDEGVDPRPKNLIVNGVLTEYLNHRETAHRFDLQPNGGARAQDGLHHPLVRMSNTVIQGGTHRDLDELIEDIDFGIYACGSRGGQVDTGRGSFQFAAQEAWIIENGSLSRPVKDVSVSGMTLQILKDVDGLTKDSRLAAPGFCGKGQTVPVGDGGPIMRIREALVG
jgi:TldD protein